MFEWLFRKVQKLIERFGLLNPRDLAEALGLIIFPLPFKKLHGMFLSLPAIPVIFIKPDDDYRKENASILHETFHHVLHPRTNRFLEDYVPLIKTQRGRYELQAHTSALIYAIMWDKDLFEQLGCNVYKFTEIYGFPYDVAFYVDTGIQKNGLEIFGITPPDPELYTP